MHASVRARGALGGPERRSPARAGDGRGELLRGARCADEVAAENRTGCCVPGRRGLLCEQCSAGYSKQNDVCVPCTGPAWSAIAAQMGVKAGLTLLLVAKVRKAPNWPRSWANFSLF
jgi:hypothetical protein